MADPLASLTVEVADLRRRLQALETAPRAALTSIDSGGLTIAAGGSLDVPNEDGTGSALSVVGGELRFPVGVGIWQQFSGVLTSTQIGDGGPQTLTASIATYISLGSDTVDGEFEFNISGSGEWYVELTARAVGGAHDGAAEPGSGANATTGIAFTGFEIASSPRLESGPWTIPDTLWDPNGHPGGTVAEIIMYSQRTSGTGSCFVRPTKPLMSI